MMKRCTLCGNFCVEALQVGERGRTIMSLFPIKVKEEDFKKPLCEECDFKLKQFEKWKYQVMQCNAFSDRTEDRKEPENCDTLARVSLDSENNVSVNSLIEEFLNEYGDIDEKRILDTINGDIDEKLILDMINDVCIDQAPASTLETTNVVVTDALKRKEIFVSDNKNTTDSKTKDDEVASHEESMLVTDSSSNKCLENETSEMIDTSNEVETEGQAIICINSESDKGSVEIECIAINSDVIGEVSFSDDHRNAGAIINSTAVEKITSSTQTSKFIALIDLTSDMDSEDNELDEEICKVSDSEIDEILEIKECGQSHAGDCKVSYGECIEMYYNGQNCEQDENSKETDEENFELQYTVEARSQLNGLDSSKLEGLNTYDYEIDCEEHLDENRYVAENSKPLTEQLLRSRLKLALAEKEVPEKDIERTRKQPVSGEEKSLALILANHVENYPQDNSDVCLPMEAQMIEELRDEKRPKLAEIKRCLGQRGPLRFNMFYNNVSKYYLCTFCNFKSTRRVQFSKHLISHKEVRDVTYTCSECNKVCLNRSSFQGHLKHHQNDLLMCNECQKPFKWKCDLQTHINKHIGIKPYRCNSCTKEFISQRSQKRHTKAHGQVSSFHCGVCSKQFRSRSGLDTHFSATHY